jgi:beta-glucosidase
MAHLHRGRLDVRPTTPHHRSPLLRCHRGDYKWMRMIVVLALVTLAATVQSAPLGAAEQQQSQRPWMGADLDPDSRTRLLLAAMTRNEKLTLVFGYFSSDAPWKNFKRPAEGLEQSAGYIGGIARLGIPTTAGDRCRHRGREPTGAASPPAHRPAVGSSHRRQLGSRSGVLRGAHDRQ